MQDGCYRIHLKVHLKPQKLSVMLGGGVSLHVENNCPRNKKGRRAMPMGSASLGSCYPIVFLPLPTLHCLIALFLSETQVNGSNSQA